jgi:hypothetical protein
LASCFEGGETRDFHRLASKCISVVLEMEVAADGKACRSSGDQSIDSENPTWGQAQIAAELLLKIGIRLSPRTVAKYMLKAGARPWSGVGSQTWRTFLQNHAKQMVSCDFFTVVTASFKVLYVFIVMEHGSRRIVHFNVTDHPTAG